MDADEFYKARDDRIRLYGERRLPHDQPVLVSVESEYSRRFDGQVATLTAANLLSRMTPNVVLDVPNVSLHERLPWKGTLREVVLQNMHDADPFAKFDVRDFNSGDYVLRIGRSGGDRIIHGCGWNAYVGPKTSPLPEAADGNAFGAAFAAINAAALIFRAPFPAAFDDAHVTDTLRWQNCAGADAPIGDGEVGKVWIVGAGSVGSAAAYFMAIGGLRFEPTIFDMDEVKIENLNRSPVFRFADCREKKVAAVKSFLEDCGIETRAIPESLAASGALKYREVGIPDLMVSAANEENVRYEIEQAYPPIQIFGTTGRNWQSAVLRLIPPEDACSCCIFRPETPVSTACATESNHPAPANENAPDAALPFLSFAAGLMAAAETAKLTMPGFPFSENRAFFQPLADEPVFSATLSRRPDCFCATRSKNVFARVIQATRFAKLYQGV